MPAGNGNGNGIGNSVPPVDRVETGTGAGDLLDFGEEIVALRINSGDGDDTILGGGDVDRVNGGDGNDWIEGNAGDDIIFGNDGEDTAAYAGSIFDYIWAEGSAGTITVQDTNADDGDTGTDAIKQIEYLSFNDYLFSFAGPNAAMILADDQSTGENDPVTFSVAGWDFDGGIVAVVSASVTGGGTLTLDGSDGVMSAGNGVGESWSFTFDPGTAYDSLALGDQATETATFEISDGQGNLSSASIVITINGENDAPVIDLLTYVTDSVAEDGVQTATGSVTASDPDNCAVLSFSGASGALGTLSVDVAGNWTYTLDNAAAQSLSEGQTVTDSVTLTVTDEHGATDTVLVEIDVAGANDLPTIDGVNIVTGTVTEDDPGLASGQVLASDIDLLDVLAYSVATQGAYGTAVIDANGNWTYALNNGLEAVQNLTASDALSDVIVFRVDDGHGGEDTVSVGIDIAGADDVGPPPSSTTLTFEEFGSLGFPGGSLYGGLMWSDNSVAIDGSIFGSSDGRDAIVSGFVNGVVSGSNILFNGGGNELTIWSDSNFDLESLWLTSAFRDGMTVHFTGFDDGVAGPCQEATVSTGGPVFVSLIDFNSVDMVTITATGGVNPGFPGDGTYFVIDDLTFFA